MRLRATIGYDGAPFHGFALNPDVPTVAGALINALELLLQASTPIVCAGRTDKGVHSRGQVISFDVPDDVDLARLLRLLNKHVGPEIFVHDLSIAAPDFDARFHATSRTYRYRILASPTPDPLRRLHTWHVAEPLDAERLSAATDSLLGLHDFRTFCRKPKVAPGAVEPTMMRRVHRAEWDVVGDEFVLEIAAKSFCQQMVRSIVGTAVDVGRGDIAVGAMAEKLEARDRQAVGTVAPPHALVLWAVGY